MKQFKVTVVLKDGRFLDVVITATDHWKAREIAAAQFGSNFQTIHYCEEI